MAPQPAFRDENLVYILVYLILELVFLPSSSPSRLSLVLCMWLAFVVNSRVPPSNCNVWRWGLAVATCE